MGAEIAEVQGAEERVAQGVDQGVGVRMPREPRAVLDPHAPEDERPSLDERMDVVADSYPERARVLFQWSLDGDGIINPPRTGEARAFFPTGNCP